MEFTFYKYSQGNLVVFDEIFTHISIFMKVHKSRFDAKANIQWILPNFSSRLSMIFFLPIVWYFDPYQKIMSGSAIFGHFCCSLFFPREDSDVHFCRICYDILSFFFVLNIQVEVWYFGCNSAEKDKISGLKMGYHL